MQKIENTDVKRWLAAIEKARASSKNVKQLNYIVHLSSKPKRQRISVNLDKIEKMAKENDNIIIPGKVLGGGTVTKAVNVAAISWTASATQKLKGSKVKVVKIEDIVGNKTARIII